MPNGGLKVFGIKTYVLDVTISCTPSPPNNSNFQGATLAVVTICMGIKEKVVPRPTPSIDASKRNTLGRNSTVTDIKGSLNLEGTFIV